MSELLTFIHLGFRHITDLEAMDHILFLVALAAIYRGRDWRDSLWVVSAFTVGHSITLALAVTGAVRLPTALIEFLIPLTIVATGAREPHRAQSRARPAQRPIPAGVRGGLRSGAWRGIRQLPAEPVLGLDRGPALRLQPGDRDRADRRAARWRGSFWRCSTALLTLARSPEALPSAYRLRVITVSLVVVMVATQMAAARRPW